MFCSQSLRTTVWLLAFTIWPAVLQAQPKKESVSIKGKIKAVQGDVIHVGNDTSSEWYVRMPAEPQNVFLIGTAPPTWLQAGMFVRFVAQFDAKGKAQQPVHKLDVFTPRKPINNEPPELPIMSPTTAFGAAAGGDATEGAGAKPAPGGRGKDQQAATFKVVGQVTVYKNRELTVRTMTPRGEPALVRAEVKKDAEISVNIADYRLMKAGDAVDIGGYYYPPNLVQIQADRITIKAAQPLGAADDEKPTKPTKPGTKVRPKPKSKVKGKAGGTEDLPF